MIAFGPVPSRRLGRSLGVNNIFAKHCSYACVYCQVGPTSRMEINRRVFHSSGDVVRAVERKVEACKTAGVCIDYITFVPDGEPTLDVNLGADIRALKSLGIPLAVITNGSLLWNPQVRADLAAADLVSVKVDSTRSEAWRRVNRPHGRLDLDAILGGILDFAGAFGGELLTETMLVGGINDDAGSVEGVVGFLERLGPRRAYLAVPIRPPAEATARPPDEEAVVRAYEMMAEKLASVELLVAGEEGPFGQTGDPAQDLLAILTVHPMREEAVQQYLAEASAARNELEELVRRGRVSRVVYYGDVFYVRRFSSAHQAADRNARRVGGYPT